MPPSSETVDARGIGSLHASALMSVGHPAACAEDSELGRMRSVLRTRNAGEALQALSDFHTSCALMLDGAAEWALAWPEFMRQREGASVESKITSSAHALWRSWWAPTEDVRIQEAREAVGEVLGPSSVGASGALARASLPRTPLRTLGQIETACTEGRLELALEILDAYFLQVRTRHDLLIQYLEAYARAVRLSLGQAAVEEGLGASFRSCSFQEPTWQHFLRLSPARLAEFLAAHLRLHFSGPNRAGAVTIVEEQDRYRLVFDPCGSGGALRRAAVNSGTLSMECLQEPTPATWGRAEEVPAYCAHCALNEIHSIQRVGYPLWVTEFEPDPGRPCGWTIFKRPSDIPQRYFARVGIERTASQRQAPQAGA